MADYGLSEFSLHYIAGSLSEITQEERTLRKSDSDLTALLGEKVRSLALILGQIEEEVVQRVSLSTNVRQLIYQHYHYVKTKLLELEQWPLSSDRAIEQRRSQLEDKLDQLLHEVRREHIESWQDSVRLKTEFWRWFKQYSDVALRVGLVLSNRKPSG